MYWGFLFRLGGRTRAEIYRHTTVLNVWASLADTAVAGNPIGGNLSFEVIGNSLQLFLNGSLIASAVDAKPLMAPGSVGMRSLMNTQFDNFTAKTVFTDTFTQPNGASLIAANWTNQVGAFMIANGGAASGPALNLATSTGFSATDVSVEAYATVVTGGLIGLVARDSGVDYYTGALIDSRGITYATIYRHSAAGFTLLSLVAVSRNPKIRKLRFEAIGSFLSLYVNDRLIASGTDSALPAGSVGMLSIGSGRIDNVKAIPRG